MALGDRVRANYRKAMDRAGETILLRRQSPSGPQDYPVRARIVGYTAEEIAAGVQQGARKVIVLAEDIEKSGFPSPIKIRADAVIARGLSMMIQSVDDSTRRVGTTFIAYEMQVIGAPVAPGVFDPSFDFSDPRNSGYLALLEDI